MFKLIHPLPIHCSNIAKNFDQGYIKLGKVSVKRDINPKLSLIFPHDAFASKHFMKLFTNLSSGVLRDITVNASINSLNNLRYVSFYSIHIWTENMLKKGSWSIIRWQSLIFSFSFLETTWSLWFHFCQRQMSWRDFLWSYPCHGPWIQVMFVMYTKGRYLYQEKPLARKYKFALQVVSGIKMCVIYPGKIFARRAYTWMNFFSESSPLGQSFKKLAYHTYQKQRWKHPGITALY